MRRIIAIAVVTAAGIGALLFGVGATEDSGEGYEIRAKWPWAS